jgi:hypothetical protein
MKMNTIVNRNRKMNIIMNWSRNINKDMNEHEDNHTLIFFLIQCFIPLKTHLWMIMNELPLIWGDVWQISLYYDEKIIYALIINMRQGTEWRMLPKGGTLCFEEEILHNMGSF